MKQYRNHFRNMDTFKKAVRTIKRDQLADWIKIGKHWYTEEEFDCEGANMRLTSLTDRTHIEINTSDRYSSTWLTDAELDIYRADSYRFHPQYYIDRKTYKHMKQDEKIALLDHIQSVFGAEELSEFVKNYI